MKKRIAINSTSTSAINSNGNHNDDHNDDHNDSHDSKDHHQRRRNSNKIRSSKSSQPQQPFVKLVLILVLLLLCTVMIVLGGIGYVVLGQQEKQQQEQQQQQHELEVVPPQLSSSSSSSQSLPQSMSLSSHPSRRRPLLSPKAYPVIGTYVQYNVSTKMTTKTATTKTTTKTSSTTTSTTPIDVVYALPSSSSSSSQKTTGPGGGRDRDRGRGIIVLLHACTHTAFKFFVGCDECIGLAEEMDVARQSLQRGYAVIAISSEQATKQRSKGGGCWNPAKDTIRIQSAIEQFYESLYRPWILLQQQQQQPEADSNEHDEHNTMSSPLLLPPPIFAIGTSSGGTMAATLFAHHIVDGAIIGVMALRDELVEQIITNRIIMPKQQQQVGENENGTDNNDSDKKRITPTLYFAPMPKDRGTTKRAKQNVDKLKHTIQTQQQQQQQQQQHQLMHVVFDDHTCNEIDVTPEYLYNKVYGMTYEVATYIVESLQLGRDIIIDEQQQQPQRLQPQKRQRLVKDPTKEPWRDVLLRLPSPLPQRVKESLDRLLLRKLSSSSSSSPYDTTTTTTNDDDDISIIDEFNRMVHRRQLLLRQQQHTSDGSPNVTTSKTGSLRSLSSTTSTTSFLWDTYELTPGYSSLAKALHRAWAFHEYCSDVIHIALHVFEEI